MSVSVTNCNTGCGAVAAIKPLALQFDICEPFFYLLTQVTISFDGYDVVCGRLRANALNNHFN
jgi:hypothetical protein